MKVVETDTLKVKYAHMPITDLSVSFLVAVVEPVELVIRQMSFSHGAMLIHGNDPLKSLSDQLIREWYGELRKSKPGIDLPEWMTKINKVQLIECDLLVPKQLP